MRASLRDALMKVTKHLPRRPEPQWQWNELASESVGGGYRMRNAFAVDGMLRTSLLDAQKEGPEAFEQTRALVVAYFAIQEAEVFRGFELPAQASRVRLAAEGIEELSEASTALAQFAADPSSVTHARALEEVSEAVQTGRHTMSLLAQHAYAPMSA